MSVNYSDFVDIAQQLESGEREIDWRMSAARAYYAAFHRASATATLCPSNEHLKMGTHERLTDRFDLQKSTGAKSISYVLQGMKKIRHIADYELEGDFFKCISTGQLATYSMLIDKLDSFEKLHAAKTA